MTPRKLRLMFAFFPYAGNSTGSSIMFPVMEWWGETLLKLRTDPKFRPRVESVDLWWKADTPITMTRNAAVKAAQKQGVDVLVMVDSDITPDINLGREPDAVPFIEAAFNEIYDHYDRGPLVIGAPYGGAPPHENMFVFEWDSMMSAGDESHFRLRQYERSEAQRMTGIQEAAALPTGLIMYDMRSFELIDPPYFKYEWKDKTESEKASTEDVQNTRDIAISCMHVHGYNPIRCAWSSWVGHNKVWTVGKPAKYSASDVAETLVDAVRRNMYRDEKLVDAARYLETVTPMDAPVLHLEKAI